MKRAVVLALAVLILVFLVILLSITRSYFSQKTTEEPAPSQIPSPIPLSVESSLPSTASLLTEMPLVDGIGIMGDSNSDEYRANDSRGGDYADTTMNWMEQLAENRFLNFGQWGDWGEPRRTGYEYNWARTGATAHSLITSGQHTGLAKQVAEGKVSLVFLWIGDNDFHLTNGTYEDIYNGELSDDELQAKVDQAIIDITTAVDTVLEAGPVKMVVVTISDKGLAPQAAFLFPNPAKRERVSKAIQAVNEGIKDLAGTRDVTVVDINSFAELVLKRINRLGLLEVGDQTINVLLQGDEPHHLQLSDKSGHAGTVMSGLFANALFVEPFNDAYGAGIEPLSDEEILSNAGID